ncbi:hypothetical protein ACWGHA_32870 [Streptomyces xanthophaeus]
MRLAVGRCPGEAVELGGGGVGADLESFNFSEPTVAAGLADAVAEVLDDLDEAAPLAGIDLEDRAADACIRCPMLSINPKMLPRLDELEEDLLARRFARTGPVPLGLPTVPHQNPRLTGG